MPQQGLGNYVNGSFIQGGTIPLHSKNPSHNFASVFQGQSALEHVSLAIKSAKNAYISWASLSQSARNDYLKRLKTCLMNREEAIAQAISLEMGKVISEARTEAKGLSARIDLMLGHGLKRTEQEDLFDQRARGRAHAQGVLAILGPYNFPAHLLNAHIIPSLLTGNTVVFKPSEICPLVGQEYLLAFHEAGFPPGVVNMVQGDGQVGRALAMHQEVDGVLFTGSYETGRALKEMLLDQPAKILALELGGKNFAVILDDADLTQAVSEVVVGAFLTTGQRCTATARVLVQEKVYEQVKSALIAAIKILEPTDALKDGLFGPLASEAALKKLTEGLELAKARGARPLVDYRLLPGGAFITPSLYEVEPGQNVPGYLDRELFGPNLALEKFATLDDAISRVNSSEFGLSNSIFTLDKSQSERFFVGTKSGVLNINRSTNGALGQLPFGGVKKSGNHHPAGIDAVRYTTFPVAITELSFGETSAPAWLKNDIKQHLGTTSLNALLTRHSLEKIFESFGIFSDNVGPSHVIYTLASFNNLNGQKDSFIKALKEALGPAISIDQEYIKIDITRVKSAALDGLKETLRDFDASGSLKKFQGNAINVPPGLKLKKSRSMLDRLYYDHFIPKEKKTPVIDLKSSRGPFLTSIDDDPLVLFDAASQIATVGAGFSADVFQKSYDNHELDAAILTNIDLALKNPAPSMEHREAELAREKFETFLQKQARFKIESFGYGAGGAEASEIAFDLCRRNGPGGTKIIAFEGAFHGRTIMALHATFNKTKRGPFIFDGYESAFIPFPENKDPAREPSVERELIKDLSQGKIPTPNTQDELFNSELRSLSALKDEIEKGNVCCVIIEPMQCEGGDRYATKRFFNSVRALTRSCKVPLIIDEVQTGFNLGRSFFWHDTFDLKNANGEPDFPDCVTLAKRAQLGVTLSRFTNIRTFAPHVLQLKRGLLHAEAISSAKAIELEQKALVELKRLRDFFPEYILNPRACGFAFAFDMPTNAMATNLINQRFHRGFMAYIAGEKTLRFRLNMSCDNTVINHLFEKIFVALSDLKDGRLLEGAVYEKSSLKTEEPVNISILPLTKENFDTYKHDIERIENGAYEAGRRDTLESLYGWITSPGGLGLLAKCRSGNEEILAGYAVGGPMERSSVDGPKHDPNRDQNNTFYSADITIDERVRGGGIGRALKNEQVRLVSAMKNPDGTPRYQFMTGRNRLGKADAMNKINMNLGSYCLDIYDNQYGEQGAKAMYYRLPLIKDRHEVKLSKEAYIECQNSIEMPFRTPAPGLVRALEQNDLRDIVTTKLTLSNWVTPSIVRYGELLREVIPKPMTHAYFTSGRDEVADKGIRCLRFKRQKADKMIGFSHQWFGSNSAAARSLSHNEGQPEPFSFFDWPKITHPALIGDEAALQNLKNTLTELTPEKIIGVVLELMGERSGFTFSDSFLTKASELCQQQGIPLIFAETASWMRNGQSLFLTDKLAAKPNMIWWYTGGQLGHVLVDDPHFVSEPLTLISTWDGDQVSMERAYHNILHALSLKYDAIHNFEKNLKALPLKSSGRGSFHAVLLNDAKKLEHALKMGHEQGVFFGSGFNHSLMVCPKIDASPADLSKIIAILEKL